MWYRQHINLLLGRMDTVQTTKKHPPPPCALPFIPCCWEQTCGCHEILWFPLWKSEGRHIQLLGLVFAAFWQRICSSCGGERKAQELISVGKVAHFVPGVGGCRACVFPRVLIPSFFRAEIPPNTPDTRWGSAFFTAVQPSLRTLNNSQVLWERHHTQQLLILLDSLETPGCNGYNYELMALNSPSDLMPSSPACFLFPFCLLIALPQLFVISH